MQNGSIRPMRKCGFMSQGLNSTPRTAPLAKVLLLANDLASAHAVREGIRRAGLTVILETVGSREEFFLRLRSGQIHLILAATAGLQDLPVFEVLEYADNMPVRVPLVLIGKEGEESEA